MRVSAKRPDKKCASCKRQATKGRLDNRRSEFKAALNQIYQLKQVCNTRAVESELLVLTFISKCIFANNV